MTPSPHPAVGPGPVPEYVVGVGARSGVLQTDLERLVAGTLAAAGITADAVVSLATADGKLGEPAIRRLAERHGWPLVGFPPDRLAAQPVPNPSARVRSATRTPSVAEAAALLAAGDGATLAVAKRSTPTATVAVARHPAPGARIEAVDQRDDDPGDEEEPAAGSGTRGQRRDAVAD